MLSVVLLCAASVGQRHCATAQTYRAYAPSYGYGYQQQTYQYHAPTYYQPNYLTFAPVEDPYEQQLVAARARAKLRAAEQAKGEADLAGQLGRLSETVARLDQTVGRGAAALAQPLAAQPVAALPVPAKGPPGAYPAPNAYPPPAALPYPGAPAKGYPAPAPSPYGSPTADVVPGPGPGAAGDAAPPPPVRNDVPPPVPVPVPVPSGAVRLPEKVRVLLTERCARCHTGAKSKGAPPVRLFEEDGSPSPLSPAALLRIDMATYAGTMPPGKPLEESEYSDLRAFVDSNRASIASYLKAGVGP